MNKEITIYELLGLVKDGQAPKKILVSDNYYEYNCWGNDYNDVNKNNYWLFQDYTFGSNGNRLNDKVEIINNEDKKIEEDNKIEKLDLKKEKNCKGNWKWKCNEYNISTPQKILGDKINELIDEVNALKENNKNV